MFVNAPLGLKAGFTIDNRRLRLRSITREKRVHEEDKLFMSVRLVIGINKKEAT